MQLQRHEPFTATPLVIRRIVRFEAEYLDPSTRRFVHDNPRPNHLGIVEHQQGPLRQYVADVAEARSEISPRS